MSFGPWNVCLDIIACCPASFSHVCDLGAAADDFLEIPVIEREVLMGFKKKKFN
jgi:hypothetical protein